MEVSKVYTMDHSGEELDQAIDKVNNGYFLPEGTVSIVRNGTTDVKQYANANVKVPITDFNLQDKYVYPLKDEAQPITPDGGYDALSSVFVYPIPDEYIKPSGTLDITKNGTVNVAQYASANVNIPQNVTGIVRSATGEYTVTENTNFKDFSMTFDFVPKCFLIWANLTTEQENTNGSIASGFYFNDCGDLNNVSGLGLVSSLLGTPAFVGLDSIEESDDFLPTYCFEVSDKTILPGTAFQEGGDLSDYNYVLTSATTYLWFALG